LTNDSLLVYGIEDMGAGEASLRFRWHAILESGPGEGLL
jgi:hypothetical protein